MSCKFLVLIQLFQYLDILTHQLSVTEATSCQVERDGVTCFLRSLGGISDKLTLRTISFVLVTSSVLRLVDDSRGHYAQRPGIPAYRGQKYHGIMASHDGRVCSLRAQCMPHVQSELLPRNPDQNPKKALKEIPISRRHRRMIRYTKA